MCFFELCGITVESKRSNFESPPLYIKYPLPCAYTRDAADAPVTVRIFKNLKEIGSTRWSMQDLPHDSTLFVFYVCL